MEPHIITLKKVCSTCNELKPVAEFYLKQKKCRICYNKQRRTLYKVKKTIPMDRTHKKICRTCGIEKVLLDFPKNYNMKDSHFNDCRRCYNFRQVQKYRLSTKEKLANIYDTKEIFQKIFGCSNLDELSELKKEYSDIFDAEIASSTNIEHLKKINEIFQEAFYLYGLSLN